MKQTRTTNDLARKRRRHFAFQRLGMRIPLAADFGIEVLDFVDFGLDAFHQGAIAQNEYVAPFGESHAGQYANEILLLDDGFTVEREFDDLFWPDDPSAHSDGTFALGAESVAAVPNEQLFWGEIWADGVVMSQVSQAEFIVADDFGLSDIFLADEIGVTNIESTFAGQLPIEIEIGQLIDDVVFFDANDPLLFETTPFVLESGGADPQGFVVLDSVPLAEKTSAAFDSIEFVNVVERPVGALDFDLGSEPTVILSEPVPPAAFSTPSGVHVEPFGEADVAPLFESFDQVNSPELAQASAPLPSGASRLTPSDLPVQSQMVGLVRGISHRFDQRFAENAFAERSVSGRSFTVDAPVESTAEANRITEPLNLLAAELMQDLLQRNSTIQPTTREASVAHDAQYGRSLGESQNTSALANFDFSHSAAFPSLHAVVGTPMSRFGAITSFDLVLQTSNEGDDERWAAMSLFASRTNQLVLLTMACAGATLIVNRSITRRGALTGIDAVFGSPRELDETLQSIRCISPA